MKNPSLRTKLAVFAMSAVATASALAVPPDLTAVGTEGATGIAAGVTAGIPIAGAMLAIVIAIQVFKKVRNAGK